MGEVYRARDPRLNRIVAIKILPASFSADPDRLQRFAQESRAAAALNHPNILSIFDIGDDGGVPYVVSELLEGETLRDRLRNGALSSRKAIDYAQQIARGLAAAHEKGIAHRDLKPENLFITNDGHVKILDFGLAKFTHPEAELPGDAPTIQVATEAGTVLGTAGYMSPEQVRGKAADSRSDIFSFGAILYEMLSGKRAFHGDSAADTMSAILKEEPPDLAETNRNVSPALERIVRHCLEKNPAERFQSTRDVAFNLEALTDISTASRGGLRAVPEEKSARRWLLPLLAGLLLPRPGLVFIASRTRGSSASTPPSTRLPSATASSGMPALPRMAKPSFMAPHGTACRRKFSRLVSTVPTPALSVWRPRRFFPSPRKERWRLLSIPRIFLRSRRRELWLAFRWREALRAKYSKMLPGPTGRRTASPWRSSVLASFQSAIWNFPRVP